jgi:hypothetical protein
MFINVEEYNNECLVVHYESPVAYSETYGEDNRNRVIINRSKRGNIKMIRETNFRFTE